jgi:hypothetical protein
VERRRGRDFFLSPELIEASVVDKGKTFREPASRIDLQDDRIPN